MLVALHGGLLVLGEEHIRAIGEGALQTGVASLVHQELLVAALWRLRVKYEPLALGRSRVKAVEVPVAAVDSPLHLELAVLHAALLDGVHLAGAVADDQRRSGIGLCLGDGLKRLHGVGTHGNLRHVHVTVGHRDLAQRLLLDLLACGGKLSNLSQTRGLGCLTSRIGVDLGVKDEDVDIIARGEDVIQATETGGGTVYTGYYADSSAAV